MVDRVKISEEQYKDLQKKYPAPANELVKIEGLQPGDIVLRNPAEIEYHQFQTAIWSVEGEVGRPAAYRNAMVMQVVFPDQQTLAGWLKRWPGIALHNKVVRAINYLSGQVDSLEGK